MTPNGKPLEDLFDAKHTDSWQAMLARTGLVLILGWVVLEYCQYPARSGWPGLLGLAGGVSLLIAIKSFTGQRGAMAKKGSVWR